MRNKVNFRFKTGDSNLVKPGEYYLTFGNDGMLNGVKYRNDNLELVDVISGQMSEEELQALFEQYMQEHIYPLIQETKTSTVDVSGYNGNAITITPDSNYALMQKVNLTLTNYSGGGSATPNLVGWIAKASIPMPDANMDGTANINDNSLLRNARANLANNTIHPLLQGSYNSVAAFDATLKAPEEATKQNKFVYMPGMVYAYFDDNLGAEAAEIPVPIPLLSINGEERWIVANVYQWLNDNAYEYKFYAVYDGFPYDPSLKLGYDDNISVEII